MSNILNYIKSGFKEEISEEELQLLLEYIDLNGYYLDPENFVAPGRQICYFFNQQGNRLTLALDEAGELCMSECYVGSAFETSKTMLHKKERYEFIDIPVRGSVLVISYNDYSRLKYYNNDSTELIYKSCNGFTYSGLTTAQIPSFVEPDDIKVLDEKDASDDISKIIAIKAYADGIREKARILAESEKQI